MTRGRPHTPAERIAMGRRLMTAGELGDRHMGRIVKIGGVEGTLVGMFPRRGKVELHLLVGGARAWFALEPGTPVEVWRAP